MIPGHVKGNGNEVAIFWLINFSFIVHFLSKYPPKKQWIALTDVFIICTHPYTITRSLSSSRGSLININLFSVHVTLSFKPRPVSARIKSTPSSNLLHHIKQVHDYRSLPFEFLLSYYMFLYGFSSISAELDNCMFFNATNGRHDLTP